MRANHWKLNLKRHGQTLIPVAVIALSTTVWMVGDAEASEGIASQHRDLADSRSPLTVPQTLPIAQRIRSRDLWRQVYEQLPNLPRENEYIHLETEEVAPDNTLISRLIRYHVYVKGRPSQYRLDWKLTLADYLGANELMFEGVYPGADNLQHNPMRGDREAIASLSRAEREALVHTLVSLFNPQYLQLLEAESRTGHESPQPNTAESQPTTRQRPQQPRPGDADLLLP